MELLELKANIRNEIGKGCGRRLRREGKIPGVLYGPNTESASLSINTIDLERLLKKTKAGQLLINLTIQKNGDALSTPAMIKELQIDPVSRNFVHVDFYRVFMDRKIKVKIPVIPKGKPIGVDLGGMLQIIRREVEVLCFPNEIPEIIEVDVTNLELGHSMSVRDLVLPGNIEIPASEMNFTVFTVLSPKAEKTTTPEEEAAAAEEGGEEKAEESGEEK